MFGLGKSPHIGLTAFGGSVPQPADSAELAATSIGQGRVLVSPLGWPWSRRPPIPARCMRRAW